MSKEKPKRRRRVHTPEFKADAVKLVREGGRSVTQVSTIDYCSPVEFELIYQIQMRAA